MFNVSAYDITRLWLPEVRFIVYFISRWRQVYSVGTAGVHPFTDWLPHTSSTLSAWIGYQRSGST